MAIGMVEALRNTRSQAIADALNASATLPAYIELYSTARPATGVAITDQVLIGTLTCSDPCELTVATGILTFESITDDVSADADEDIEWARFYDGDGVFVMDASCGLTGSGATLIFNTLTARIGGVIQILSGTLTEGNN